MDDSSYPRDGVSRSFFNSLRASSATGSGADMNLYAMVGAGIGSSEAAALRTRLAAWHDAMVAHERKIRAGRIEGVCDEDCPHAEARHLWSEAVETFGDGAQGLTFLRTRAMDAAKASRRVIPSNEAHGRAASAEV